MNEVDESLFAASEVSTLPDVLTLGIMDWNDLPPNIQAACVMQTQRTDSIADLSTLRRRVLEFVHAKSLNGNPQRMVTLNRRFSRIASRRGSSTVQVIADLAERGLVASVSSGGQTAWVSTAYATEQRQIVKDAEFGTPTNWLEVHARMLENAE